MADAQKKCIGKLTLDISQVKKDINEVNDWLKKIGADINLEDKLSKKIGDALKKLVSEAKKAGEETAKALEKGLPSDVNLSVYEKMEQKVLAAENKMRAEADKTVAKMEQRAEREAAAAEKSAERQRAAHEKEQRQHEELFRKAELAAERTQQKTEQMYTQMFDRLRQQEERQQKIQENQRTKQTEQYTLMFIKQEQEALNSIIAKYQEYFNWKTKAVNAESSGNRPSANMYTKNAQDAYNEIQRLVGLYPDLQRLAEASDQVKKAQSDWLNAINTSKTKEQSEQVKAYTQSLLDLYKAQTDFNNQVASGRLREGTDEYKAAQTNIERLQDVVAKTGQVFTDTEREAIRAGREISNAFSQMQTSESRVHESHDYLTQAKTAYDNLTTAIRNYNTEKKAGNTDRAQMWKDEASAQMGVLNNLDKEISKLNIDEQTRRTILSLIEQGRTATNGMTAGTHELESQVTGLLTRYFSVVAVIRTINNLIKNTVEYVSEYYDKMNEIQIITQKSSEEVAQLGDKYRKIAEEMNVSSLEMADAAIYFTRQGLPAEEIENRLKNVTMYAKTANVEFTQASEIITAVVNSMGLMEQETEDGRKAAQRVADVFLKVGDNAATSGQEIGEAMQKAAASAGAFGVSFEWLASAIATVSETTRQEARTIGTAFNTIIARLHQIKQQGYNSDDETKINDIAKALKNIDVALMDQSGEWRNMEDIWMEVASKWSDLDGKTKSYIATTMAGVKQQNVFLAAMNDMSKSLEDGGRFADLYAKALDSAGTAEEKYSIWTDSVTAAQERLTIAQEKFYSILSADVIKGWYDGLASILNVINDGSEAMNGWNVILPVTIGLITSLTLAIIKLKAAATESGSASLLTYLFKGHPVLMAIAAGLTAVAAGIALFSAAAKALTPESYEEKIEKINKRISELEERSTKLRSIQNNATQMFQAIGQAGGVTDGVLQEYSGTLEEIASVSPEAATAVENLKKKIGDQAEQVRIINAELDEYIKKNRDLKVNALYSKYGIWKPNEVSDTGENAGAALALKMMNYDESWFGNSTDESTRFATALKKAFQETYTRNLSASEGYIPWRKWLYDEFEYMPEEVYNAVKESLDAGAESWDEIGAYIWNKFYAGLKSDPKNILDEYGKEAATELFNALSDGMDEASKAGLQYKINEVIFGEDGKMSKEEYEQMGHRIIEFLYNGAEESLDDLTIGKAVADMLFGEGTGKLIEERGAGFAKAFVDNYKRMINAGLTNQDIMEIIGVSDIPIDDYANLFNEFAQRLRGEFEVAAQDEGLNELSDKFNALDLATQKFIYDYMQMGVKITDINKLLAESSSIEEFRQKLAELYGTVGDEPKTLSQAIKDIKAQIKEIQSLDKIIKSVTESGVDESIGDILGLAETHPELLAVINDTEELIKVLQKLRDEANNKQRIEIKNMILDDEGAMKGSVFAPSGFATLREYRESLEEGGTEALSFDMILEEMIDTWQKANVSAKEAAKETKAAKKEFSDAIKEVETLDKIIAKLQDNKKIDFSDIINLSAAHPEIIAFADDAEKLIQVLQRIKAEAKADVKTAVKDILLQDEGYYKESEYYDARYKNMTEYLNALEASNGDWQSVANSVDTAAQNIVDAAESTSTAAETWLEAQMKLAEINDEVNWAKSNKYADQIGALQAANEHGGIQEAIALFETWSDQMQQAVGTEYPAFTLAMVRAKKAMAEQGDQTETLTKETKAMSAALQTATKMNSVKYFTDSARAIQQLSDGTISATDAYDVFNKEVNKVTKAYEDVLEVQAKLDYNAKEVNKNNQKNIEASDVANLASLLDMTTDQVLADFPAAVAMFDELTGAGGELADIFDELNRRAFIRITGVSEADFSNITNGLIAVQDDAEETIKMLQKTGQWDIVTVELPADMPIFDIKNGKTTYGQVKTAGHQTILKAKDTNPFSRSSSVNSLKDTSGKKSGGGGGGSNKDKNQNFRDSNVTTEVERMLDLMSQVNTIQQSQQNYYQSQQKYYTQTGQLQGTIAYMQKEKEVLEAQNPVLEENIRRIEQYMEAKKAEIATLSTDDEAYKDVADDLDKLQKAHQNYTKQLIDNKTSIDALNKSMDEQRKKIRQMEIDLRNTILKAIEDREKKRTDMLNAEIEMENTILDLIKKRYERERDEIVETTNLKINALKEERDLLDEQLRIRKEQAEAEDKQLKLRELEAKYQRILADPTRRKEAQNIKAEIDDLRKEMAWDLAEEEVKAQQDAIDQQIMSLEDYVEYVQNYYEELFEHPQKLIAEMKVVISMTHDDMINWMKENDDAYKNSSENTQQQMVEGWNSTYNEMKGILETYWEEVEEIIAQGDDYIIEFLKNNASEYAQAGKLQAEAYVDEWKKQLDDLHKAYQTVTAEVASNYQTIQQYTGSSGGSSSSSGGGGGGGGSGKSTNTASTTADKKEEHGFDAMMNGKPFSGRGVQYATAEEARQRGLHYINQEANNMIKAGMNKDVVERLKYTAVQTMKYYKYGGMNTETGLAWLDGTKQLPERILSPHQTELFETMVEALDRMSRITVSSMPNFGGLQTTGANPVNVGDIIVNVDNLDTEDDYEELAEKVKQILMDEIGRAAVVGGLRIRST